MEIIFELLFEVVGQFLIEVVGDFGFRGVARTLSNRIVKAVLGAVLAVGVGFGSGYWWGNRLTEAGRTDPPSSLWVSIALVAVFSAIALYRIVQARDERRGSPWRAQEGGASVLPWRWSATRLLGFALMNAAVATGIAVGFTPNAPLG